MVSQKRLFSCIMNGCEQYVYDREINANIPILKQLVEQDLSWLYRTDL